MMGGHRCAPAAAEAPSRDGDLPLFQAAWQCKDAAGHALQQHEPPVPCSPVGHSQCNNTRQLVHAQWVATGKKVLLQNHVASAPAAARSSYHKLPACSRALMQFLMSQELPDAYYASHTVPIAWQGKDGSSAAVQSEAIGVAFSCHSCLAPLFHAGL